MELLPLFLLTENELSFAIIALSVVVCVLVVTAACAAMRSMP